MAGLAKETTLAVKTKRGMAVKEVGRLASQSLALPAKAVASLTKMATTAETATITVTDAVRPTVITPFGTTTTTALEQKIALAAT